MTDRSSWDTASCAAPDELTDEDKKISNIHRLRPQCHQLLPCTRVTTSSKTKVTNTAQSTLLPSAAPSSAKRLQHVNPSQFLQEYLKSSWNGTPSYKPAYQDVGLTGSGSYKATWTSKPSRSSALAQSRGDEGALHIQIYPLVTFCGHRQRRPYWGGECTLGTLELCTAFEGIIAISC